MTGGGPTLAGAPWLDDPATRAVCRALTGSGHQALFVGGCVRNALLGRPVADIDIATDATPEEVMALAGAAGLHPVPTGIAHGTVTVVAEGRPFEVTTFRRDVETFGRRAVVAYTRDIAEDAARRDFTMNALYAGPDGTVVDPLGGLPDLLARRVRFVGDPAARIAEDYLRILRFFRIHAWYGDPASGLDADGLAACAAAQAGLARLSRERVGAETAKLLAAADPAPAVAAMAAAGILARVLPGADATPLAALVHLERRGRLRAALATPSRGAGLAAGVDRRAAAFPRRRPRPRRHRLGARRGCPARGQRLPPRRRRRAGRRADPRRRARAAGAGRARTRDRARGGGDLSARRVRSRPERAGARNSPESARGGVDRLGLHAVGRRAAQGPAAGLTRP